MAGITPLEGQDYIAELIYPQDLVAQTLLMGLFTNSSLTEASVWANINEPTGGGYAEITLATGSFVVASGGVTTYPQQSWTASADWSPVDVYGYYVRTDEGTPRILHFELNPQGARTMTTGNQYTVDLSTNTESS